MCIAKEPLVVTLTSVQLYNVYGVIPPFWPLECIGLICKYCTYVMYDS